MTSASVSIVCRGFVSTRHLKPSNLKPPQAGRFFIGAVGSSQIDLGNPSGFSFTNNTFSIAFWFKANPNTSYRGFFLAKYGPGNYEYAVFNDSANHVRFEAWDNSGNSLVGVSTINTWYDNNWHNAVVVGDGSKAYIYVDGAENTGGGVNFSGYMQHGGTDLLMGKASNLTPGYTGCLDDVAVFSRALTPTEIYNLYNGPAVNSLQDLAYVYDADGNITQI
ncbi:MAG: LamG domain-containing protein, partial [Patescibacteria group bacterium]|nr:LamG domain-containing protein [Patescibacteria group bacterium]